MDTKFYVLIVTLSTQDNVKLLQQLRWGFERKTNRNKCESKVSLERQNQCLDYLIDPSFQGLNKRFLLSFEDNDGRKHTHRIFFQN